MKKLLFLMVFCISVSVYAMEHQEAALMPFALLPKDTKIEIFKYVTAPTSIQQAADAIATVATVSKEFNRLINSAEITRHVIMQLNDKLRIDPICAAAGLRTLGAKDWLINEAEQSRLLTAVIESIYAIRKQMYEIVEKNPRLVKQKWVTESSGEVSHVWYEPNPQLSEEAYLKAKRSQNAKASKRLKVLVESMFASLDKEDYKGFIEVGISDLEKTAKEIDTETKEPGLSDRLGFKDSIDMLKACVEKNK
jgi:hypothetical protein